MAISDVLSDAVANIRDYLTDELYHDSYPPGAPLTQRIEAVAAEMEAIRVILDTPPTAAEMEAYRKANPRPAVNQRHLRPVT